MKISELIERLEITKAHIGDVECLIEIVSDGVYAMVPVDEVSYENREGFGPSVAFLQ